MPKDVRSATCAVLANAAELGGVVLISNSALGETFSRAEESAMKWARVAKEEAHGMRRGAWYAVVGDGKSKLVLLDVNRSNRPVNRSSLEFTDEKPHKWSVVQRDAEDQAAVRASSAELGPVYGVCPLCRARVSIVPEANEASCPRCEEVSEVDWDHPC